MCAYDSSIINVAFVFGQKNDFVVEIHVAKRTSVDISLGRLVSLSLSLALCVCQRSKLPDKVEKGERKKEESTESDTKFTTAAMAMQCQSKW